MKKLLVFIMGMTVAGFGQVTPAKLHSPAPKSKVAARSGVDLVIELLKGGMSEGLVIRTLQQQGTAYALSPADLLRLQKAGVSEDIINVMMDPKTVIHRAAAAPRPASAASSEATQDKDSTPGGAARAPAPVPPANAETPATGVTPFPPDLPNTPAVRKRRVVVAVFGFGALKDQASQVQPTNPYLYLMHPNGGPTVSYQSTTDDIGKGLQSMLMTRLQQANVVTVLERNEAVERELKQGVTAQTDPASRPKMGHMLGADCVVTGDITIFGRDDKSKTKRGILGGILPRTGAGLGGFGFTKKEQKAVVALDFRIVDAETSAVLVAGSARGESLRKSKDLGLAGLGIGSGGAAGGGFQSAMTSSGFAKTILGEATIDAVNQIVKQVDEKIPQLPAKPRKIEGRVASIAPQGVYLAIGQNDGVLRGDRFEIMQITGEVIDPQTKEVLDVQAVKVGELVVNDVRDKAAIGNYGGQPLSAAYVTGKGYLARLMSK